MSCKFIKKYDNDKTKFIKEKLKNCYDNPKLDIKQFNINNKSINFIQDGKLIAGTKQRVAKLFVKEITNKNKNIKNLAYSGYYNGFGAIAVAYACYKLNLNSYSFLSKKYDNQNLNDLKNTRQLSTLSALNSKIFICNNYKEAKNLKYNITNNNKVQKKDFYIVPMGLNDDEDIMINLLSKQLRKASKGTLLEHKKNPRIWLVSGSGGIAMALKKAFPNAHLLILLTGGIKYKNKVEIWAKKENNITIIKNEKFNSHKLNYYPSVKDYNNLIFPYINKYAKNNDFVWNVSSDNLLNNL